MFRRKRNKKGFDKPIEIFIFLFIIIVVATVVLRMFKAEVADQQGELSEVQHEEMTAQSLRQAKTQCRELCSDAGSDDCSLKSVAAFCGKNVGPIDLNGNGGTSDFNTGLLGGVGVCEDKIYCPLLVDCTCAEKLDINTCEQKLCDYWSQMGMSNPGDKLDDVYNKSCNVPGSEFHWTDGLSGSC